MSFEELRINRRNFHHIEDVKSCSTCKRKRKSNDVNDVEYLCDPTNSLDEPYFIPKPECDYVCDEWDGR